MPEAARRIWLLSKEPAGDLRMSPGARLRWMSESAARAGREVEVVCCVPGDPSLDQFLANWTPGQPVVLDPYVPGRALVRLLRSRISFDADFYCVSLPEIAELFPARSPGWVRQERLRRARKYAWITRAARQVYVSTSAQTVAMAGILAGGPDPRAELVGSLPRKSLDLPLGVSIPAPGRTFANPYTALLGQRPVVLWGGGIWPWFDMETLLQAFAQLPDRDQGPALFFLSSSNNRSDPESDHPIHATRERARELGLLDRNVFFNPDSTGPEGIAPYLAHCAMGALANPRSWEALVSWRTRYLDLIAHGKPLVVAGSDPLGDRIAREGGARVVPAGDAAGLSREILALAHDGSTRALMGARSGSLGEALSREALGRIWMDSLSASEWLPRPPAGPSLRELVLYRAGR